MRNIFLGFCLSFVCGMSWASQVNDDVSTFLNFNDNRVPDGWHFFSHSKRTGYGEIANKRWQVHNIDATTGLSRNFSGSNFSKLQISYKGDLESVFWGSGKFVRLNSNKVDVPQGTFMAEQKGWTSGAGMAEYNFGNGKMSLQISESDRTGSNPVVVSTERKIVNAANPGVFQFTHEFKDGFSSVFVQDRSSGQIVGAVQDTNSSLRLNDIQSLTIGQSLTAQRNHYEPTMSWIDDINIRASVKHQSDKNREDRLKDKLGTNTSPGRLELYNNGRMEVLDINNTGNQNPDGKVYVLVHGWSGREPWSDDALVKDQDGFMKVRTQFREMAQAIQEKDPDARVLVYNWEHEAYSPSAPGDKLPKVPNEKVTGQMKHLDAQLQTLLTERFDGKIHFLSHSLGAGVVGELIGNTKDNESFVNRHVDQIEKVTLFDPPSNFFSIAGGGSVSIADDLDRFSQIKNENTVVENYIAEETYSQKFDPSGVSTPSQIIARLIKTGLSELKDESKGNFGTLYQDATNIVVNRTGHSDIVNDWYRDTIWTGAVGNMTDQEILERIASGDIPADFVDRFDAGSNGFNYPGNDDYDRSDGSVYENDDSRHYKIDYAGFVGAFDERTIAKIVAPGLFTQSDGPLIVNYEDGFDSFNLDAKEAKYQPFANHDDAIWYFDPERGGVYQGISHSPVLFTEEFTFANDSLFMSFEYNTGEIDVADSVFLSFDDEILFELTGADILSGEWLFSGLIDVSDFAGLTGLLTIGLMTELDGIDFSFANLKEFSSIAAVPIPAGLVLYGSILLCIGGGAGIRRIFIK